MNTAGPTNTCLQTTGKFVVSHIAKSGRNQALAWILKPDLKMKTVRLKHSCPNRIARYSVWNRGAERNPFIGKLQRLCEVVLCLSTKISISLESIPPVVREKPECRSSLSLQHFHGPYFEKMP